MTWNPFRPKPCADCAALRGDLKRAEASAIALRAENDTLSERVHDLIAELVSVHEMLESGPAGGVIAVAVEEAVAEQEQVADQEGVPATGGE